MSRNPKRFISVPVYVAFIIAGCCLPASGIGQESSVKPDASKVTTASDVQPTARSPVARSLESTPWFDAEKTQIVPIAIKPRTDDSIHRDSRWLPKPEAVKKTTPQANSATTANSGATNGLFGTSMSLGNLFGWVLLLVIAMAIVGAIVYAISRAEINLPDNTKAAGAGSKDGQLPDEQTLERIKHLPPELRRTDVNLRTECERLKNEGRFDQAIILLLGHQLLLLDRNGLLRLSRGKTNGRYVRETRTNDQGSATYLRATADAFEQSYFGRHEIPAEVFEELWKQNDLLESAANTFGAAS